MSCVTDVSITDDIVPEGEYTSTAVDGIPEGLGGMLCVDGLANSSSSNDRRADPELVKGKGGGRDREFGAGEVGGHLILKS